MKVRRKKSPTAIQNGYVSPESPILEAVQWDGKFGGTFLHGPTSTSAGNKLGWIEGDGYASGVLPPRKTEDGDVGGDYVVDDTTSDGKIVRLVYHTDDFSRLFEVVET